LVTDKQFILAIDQGTTSSKALVIDSDGEILAGSEGKFGFEGIYPEPGWVEYDPVQILESVRGAAISAVKNAGLQFSDIAAIGLDNQGETVIAFDATDGKPLCNAISWQDRRTEDIVARWRQAGLEGQIFDICGLRLDPYFSASKLVWILENCPQAKKLHDKGQLRLGTSDSWLIWQMTAGRSFITDAATASRTMMLDLTKINWSPKLLEAYEIPIVTLPQVVPNAGKLAVTKKGFWGVEIPITGLCVDQHAALFGQGCYKTNQAKATYGTGCFVLTNIGEESRLRGKGLLTALGWQIDGKTSYIMEGGVYSAGSIVEWLIQIGIISKPSELDELAMDIDDTGGVNLIPAFSGLAAPHWKSHVRACWTGINNGTDRRHLVRSVLESIAYRVRDIHQSMLAAGVKLKDLRADGGLTRSNFLMQYQADVLDCPLAVSKSAEVTAIGVGLMAGIGAKIWGNIDSLPAVSKVGSHFTPQPKKVNESVKKYELWYNICQDIIRHSGNVNN